MRKTLIMKLEKPPPTREQDIQTLTKFLIRRARRRKTTLAHEAQKLLTKVQKENQNRNRVIKMYKE
jgi:hypothetical protein